MARRVLNRLRRDERGFTLPEVLVVSSGLAVILAAILGLADVASKLAPQERERVHAMRDAEVALGKMTRELREAHIISITGWKATATLLKDGATITVVYDCSDAADSEGLRKCDRTQTGGSGAGTQQAIARVANPNSRPVFTAVNRNDGSGQPWTTYVKARLEVPARGERSVGARTKVVFEDGVYLRNVDALH